MAILWKKKKNLGTGVTHKENRRKKEKRWKLYRTSKDPTRPNPARKRSGEDTKSFPEQETGEAARNEAQPKPEYPISQAAAAQSTGLRKEDPHLNSSARATAASGARTGELMIGEVEPAELERIRGRSSSEL